MNEEVNRHASEFLRRKIRTRVRDPDVAHRLLPDHPFGARRVPLENGYYEVFNRGNVRLVDLRETPIVAITKRGIRNVRRGDCARRDRLRDGVRCGHRRANAYRRSREAGIRLAEQVA